MQSFDGLLNIMDRLLADGGCPWDRAQTHESLRQYLIEETYEVIDAVNNGDMDALKEELGDVLLQVVFHAKLAEREGAFDTNDVCEAITGKLVSRHTHIFGGDKAATAGDVELFWEKNKQKEKQYATVADEMAAVPSVLPALIRAEKIWKKVPKAVRKTETVDALSQGIIELLKDISACPERIGEILFKLVKISALLEINAEFSLTNIMEAFITSERKNL